MKGSRQIAPGMRRIAFVILGSQLGVMGHMNFEISVTDWAPELTTSEAISPPRLPDTTDGPTAEMRPKLEVTETS